MPAWSEWKDIEQNKNYKGCGVYKIRLVDSKDRPIEIPRFLDNDKDGILQIGNSKDIETRIKYFRGAAEGKRYPNAEGERLSLIKKYAYFRERYKDCKIQYSFKHLQDKDEAQKEEEHLPDKEIWESLNCG